ncbi:ABC transporter permease [Bifidobacterium italicum]|uniref:ABC transporter permease n=1 Tax=Bifidobacterium italicum TaxID=1960968 RepID=A0A2A2EDW1_9BIFI|nr:ABC transporter permease [Bifidobacterium italicum]PAU67167.1 ABC transporter permease [Bifidobacterium italicum]
MSGATTMAGDAPATTTGAAPRTVPLAQPSVGTFVRLRWAITMATLRRSVWQLVGFIVTVIVAVGCVVGALAGGIALGVQSDPLVGVVLRIAVPLAGAFAILLAVLIQLMIVGENSTMTPDNFAIYGIGDRRLTTGLVAAGLAGPAGVAFLLCLLAFTPAYAHFGAAAVVAAVAGAFAVIVTAMLCSKAMLSLFGVLVRSQAGKNLFYIAMMILIILLAEAPSMMMASLDTAGTAIDVRHMVRAADVVGWTPLGAPFMLPFDAADGAWGVFAARLLIVAATCAVCWWLTMWSLRYARTHNAAISGGKAEKGLGMFGRTSDSPSGAVTARLLCMLRRDPRQSVMFVMPPLIVLIFALMGRQIGDWYVWAGMIVSCMMFALAEANGLGYDGRGFAMEVICGAPAIDDRRGRARAYVLVATVSIVVLFAISMACSGFWRTPSGWLLGLTLGVCGWSWTLATIGVAEAMNPVFMYPTPSLEKPFSTPQGRGAAQMFIPLLQMLLFAAVMIPTIAVAVGLGFGGALDRWYPVLIPVAIANGAGALWLGTWLGAKLLERRKLKVLATLDGFAALQQ